MYWQINRVDESYIIETDHQENEKKKQKTNLSFSNLKLSLKTILPFNEQPFCMYGL